MALTELGTDFQWNKMLVGPIRDMDKPLATGDRVWEVAPRIFYVQTPTPGSKYEEPNVTVSNSVSSRGGESGGVKAASSFYFGTSSYVRERDENGEKFWVRQSDTRDLDRVGWVRYERHAPSK